MACGYSGGSKWFDRATIQQSNVCAPVHKVGSVASRKPVKRPADFWFTYPYSAREATIESHATACAKVPVPRS